MVKAKPGDKGSEAEEALADYFRASGFFAVRAVPFRHDGEDLTDIDVWLYERGGSLGRRRFIVDAKNRKTPRVVERLLWTSGLRDALALDGAFVASTGAREATHRLARRLGITIIDLQVLGAGSGLDSIRDRSRLSRDELDAAVAAVDRQRESRLWRDHLNNMLGALLTSFGGSGANVALRAARFYAEQAMSAVPNSEIAAVGVRLFFLSAAAAAASLDFVVAQSAFRPPEQRRRDLEDVIRYGTDPSETKGKIELALQLAREYLPNGGAAASQIAERIRAMSLELPADMIAEVVLKMAWKGNLFEAARALESAAHQRQFTGFSHVSTEARSFAGVVLDFSHVDRALFAKAFERAADLQGVGAANSPDIPQSGATGSLFDDKGSRS